MIRWYDICTSLDYSDTCLNGTYVTLRINMTYTLLPKHNKIPGDYAI